MSSDRHSNPLSRLGHDHEHPDPPQHTESPRDTAIGIPVSLTDLVRRHRICWEIWPEYVFVDHVRRQIGFTLELSGTHEAGVTPVTPGCPRCQQVYDALRRIAVHILPPTDRPSVYDVASFDHAIHYSEVRGGRPDICLPISILHRGNLDDPAGACQERCLHDMQQRLRQLGSPEHRWRSRTEDP